jgi:hypothetical protein
LSVVGIQSAPESDNIQSPETCRCRNQAAEILLVPESGTGRPNSGWNIAGFWPSRPDLAKTAMIRQESGNGDRTLPDSGDNCQTLIFAFRNFFVRTKHRKIFSRKSFFLKMISSKSFYVETNGA